ncbi:MAG: hypothetical protein WKF73_05425 [Nocardioidaceae bacterium]
MKLGRGGLSDVEWTVQLLQLQHAHDHLGLRTPETLRALEAAVDAELVSAAQAAPLTNAWRLASGVRNASMLVRGRPSDSLPTQPRDRKGVAFLCGYDMSEAGRLGEDYLRVARRARAAVDQVFWS